MVSGAGANERKRISHPPAECVLRSTALGMELGEFLRTNVKGPEHQALLRLIGMLVEVPPYG
jgi:hypothetical protein